MNDDVKAARRAEWQAGADDINRRLFRQPAAPVPCEQCVTEEARPVGWIGTASHVHQPYRPVAETPAAAADDPADAPCRIACDGVQ